MKMHHTLQDLVIPQAWVDWMKAADRAFQLATDDFDTLSLWWVECNARRFPSDFPAGLPPEGYLDKAQRLVLDRTSYLVPKKLLLQWWAISEDIPVQNREPRNSLSPQEFIQIWQTSESVAEVLTRSGMNYTAASTRASLYRKKGIPLKCFRRRVATLKNLAVSLT